MLEKFFATTYGLAISEKFIFMNLDFTKLLNLKIRLVDMLTFTFTCIDDIDDGNGQMGM